MALAEGTPRAQFSHPQLLTEKVIRQVTFEPIRKLQVASFCLMCKTLETIVHIYVSKCPGPQASHSLHLTFSFAWKCAAPPHGGPRMLSFLGITCVGVSFVATGGAVASGEEMLGPTSAPPLWLEGFHCSALVNPLTSSDEKGSS